MPVSAVPEGVLIPQILFWYPYGRCTGDKRFDALWPRQLSSRPSSRKEKSFALSLTRSPIRLARRVQPLMRLGYAFFVGSTLLDYTHATAFTLTVDCHKN